MHGIDRRFMLGALAALPASQIATAKAQPMQVTAVDIALEPDATMIQHAKADNARCLSNSRKGLLWMRRTTRTSRCFSSSFARQTSIRSTMRPTRFLQKRPASWKLKAFKYYYIPSPPIGLAGIVVEPIDDLRRLQREIIAAVAPFTEKTGTPASFMSTEDGRDI